VLEALRVNKAIFTSFAASVYLNRDFDFSELALSQI